MLATDDPTGELGAAWGVKEALRLILASPTIEAARAAKARFDAWVAIADTDETDRFAATITSWWPAIEVTIATGVTNARTEAANTAIKHISGPGAATATTPTTKPVSCSAAPTGRGNTA